MTKLLRRLLFLVLLGALSSGCADVGNDSAPLEVGVGSQETAQNPSPAAIQDLPLSCQSELTTSGAVSYAHPFVELADWVQFADSVALIEIQDERLGREFVVGEPEPEIESEVAEDLGIDPSEFGDGSSVNNLFTREVKVHVHQTLHGDLEAGSTFWMLAHDTVSTDEEGRPNQQQCFALSVGTRAIVGILGDPSDGEMTNLMTADSAFIVQGNEIRDTRRSNPIVEQLESLTVDELVNQIARESVTGPGPNPERDAEPEVVMPTPSPTIMESASPAKDIAQPSPSPSD